MSFDPKKWGILVVVLAVVGGVFGWWAYQSYGSGSFAVTLKNDTELTNGEVLHLTLDGAETATTFTDISGGGNNATSTFAATTTVPGAVGQALYNASPATQWLHITPTNFPTSNITVSLWAKPTAYADWITYFATEGWNTTSGSINMFSDSTGAVFFGVSNGAQAVPLSTSDVDKGDTTAPGLRSRAGCVFARSTHFCHCEGFRARRISVPLAI